MVRTTRCSVSGQRRAPGRLVNRPIVTLAALGVLWAGVPASAQQPRGADALSPDRIVAMDPRWTVSFDTPHSAPPGYDQEMAYVPLKSGEVLAIALDNGAVKWRVELPTSLAPATGDGLVFVAANTAVSALEQRSGRVVWNIELGGRVSAPLQFDSGWVLASTETELIAIRAADGEVRWRAAVAAALAVAPAASAEHFYAALSDGRIAAIGIETGAVVWSFALNQPVTGMLALPEQLLVGTRANLLHSLSLDRGRIRWSQKAGADVIGAPAADDRSIYLVAFDNVLRALNRGNGNIRWTRNLPSRPAGGALRAANLVFVPFSTPVIGAYLATTGTEAFTIRATDEIAGEPFLREHMGATAARLIAVSRDGLLQGFAQRYEPPAAALTDLPGNKVGG
jgi:outer membrane protein assembly factor BamB